MRCAVLGDIHGNLEALDAVLAAIEKRGPVQYFCCGDIVGYGADPQTCLERVQRLGASVVAGNHDWAAGGRNNAEAFNPLARFAIEWTKTQLNDFQKAFLRDLPLVRRRDEVTIVHGSLHEPEKFHYLDNLLEANLTLQKMTGQICFVAHNHIPAIIVSRKGKEAIYFSGYSVQCEKDCRYIINIGSVGQPRDGYRDAAYCFYDSDQRHIEICRIPYDVKTAQKKILKMGLPSPLAIRLGLGS